MNKSQYARELETSRYHAGMNMQVKELEKLSMVYKAWYHDGYLNAIVVRDVDRKNIISFRETLASEFKILWIERGLVGLRSVERALFVSHSVDERNLNREKFQMQQSEYSRIAVLVEHDRSHSGLDKETDGILSFDKQCELSDEGDRIGHSLMAEEGYVGCRYPEDSGYSGQRYKQGFHRPRVVIKNGERRVL